MKETRPTTWNDEERPTYLLLVTFVERIAHDVRMLRRST